MFFCFILCLKYIAAELVQLNFDRYLKASITLLYLSLTFVQLALSALHVRM